MLLLLCLHTVIASLSHPSQIRTAWTEHPNELSVRWATFSLNPLSMIAYRPVNCSSKSKWKYQKAEVQMFKEGNFYFQFQYVHTVILQNLDPYCLYEYQVGTFFYWSDVRTISGYTPGNDIGTPLKLVVLGDMGSGANSTDSRRLLTKFANEREMVGILHIGDIAYNLNDLGGYIGDKYLEEIDPIVSQVAYMTMPGNHEHYKHFESYIRRFRMPDVTQAPDTNFFYSFDMGKAHFIVLNSEAYFYQGNQAREVQAEWLKADLEKASLNRMAVPWVFAFAHKPIYCSMDYTKPLDSPHTNYNCGEEATIVRAAWEKLFYDFEVDVYFSGHVHNYQRLTPIYHNRTDLTGRLSDGEYANPTSPIYIVDGIAGSNHGKEPVSKTPQHWSTFNSNSYGFGMLTVCNETHTLWEHYDAEKEIVEDSLWIVKTLS